MLKKLSGLRKTNKVVLLATLLYGFMIIPSDVSHLVIPLQGYMVLHTLLEFVAVTIAFSIAMQGWMVFPHTLSKHRLYVAALFLSVGLFDLVHIFTYEGMYFISSSHTSIWYWIIARLFESIGLMYIFLKKDRSTFRGEREVVFAASVSVFFIVSFFYFLFQESIPSLVTQGRGTTELKNGLEYAVNGFRVIAIIFILRNRQRLGSNDDSTRMLLYAFWLLILSETFFMLYKNFYDIINLFGHFFKFGGYFYLMKAIYSSTIEEPYIRQKETRAELNRSKQELQVITDAMGEGMLVIDKEGRLTFINPEAEQLLGWSFEELKNKNFHDTIHYLKEDGSENTWGECKTRVSCFVNHTGLRENDIYIRKDGSSFDIEFTATPIMNNGIAESAVVVFRDISEQKKKHERIQYLAHHDELTGLPNRYYFQQLLSGAISTTKPDGCKIGVMLLDIDRFKYVNDSLGHDAGDDLLKEVAARLNHVSQALGITVSRMGGDKFLMMVQQLRSPEEACRISERILQEFALPYPLKGADFYITPSIGICLYPEHGQDTETLIKHADVAMYTAKEQRNTFKLYYPEMNRKSLELLHLENDLRGALERGEFKLHYQPQISIESNQLIGVEALLRWNHPVQGWISPAEFIPLAEEIGLIIPIGRWVLQEACGQMQQWRKQGLRFGCMSVNVSNKQFHDGHFVETVMEILEETGLDPHLLDLEITESVTMHQEAVTPIMQRLKQLGVEISIDDFGTGYSSLSCLKSLPIDRLKIDRSFVKEIMTAPNEAAIVTAIISMAHHLGMKVIAEGVETEEIVNFLRQHRCDQIQGYYYSKPLPAFELESSFGAVVYAQANNAIL